MFSLCLQLYGSSEYLYDFALLNGIQIDSVIMPGDTIVYDETLGDNRIKDKIAREAIKMINTQPEDLPAKKEGVGFWIVGNDNIVQ